MCIMALPVRSVSNTRIFVGSADGIQLTVYEMAVRLATPGNAMILPAPATSADLVGLIDMSEAPKFFDDADKLFVPMTLGMSKGGGRRSRGFLEVQEVGNYQVSIAESLDDLDRVNPEVFTLSPDAKATLGTYSSGFCFVVAQLKDSGQFHALAYTHPVAPDGTMFIPTKHEHGTKVARHPQLEGERADWDHHVYYQATPAAFTDLPGSKNKSETRSNANRYGQIANWAKQYAEKVPELAPFLDASQNTRIIRSRFHGKLRNIDLHLEA
jgi:hypothetical protein